MRQLPILLGLCLIISVASAQTLGEITGEVKDPTGAVAPGASITATNTDTNISRITVTNTAGVYSFPALVRLSHDVAAQTPMKLGTMGLHSTPNGGDLPIAAFRHQFLQIAKTEREPKIPADASYDHEGSIGGSETAAADALHKYTVLNPKLQHFLEII